MARDIFQFSRLVINVNQPRQKTRCSEIDSPARKADSRAQKPTKREETPRNVSRQETAAPNKEKAPAKTRDRTKEPRRDEKVPKGKESSVRSVSERDDPYDVTDDSQVGRNSEKKREEQMNNTGLSQLERPSTKLRSALPEPYESPAKSEELSGPWYQEGPMRLVYPSKANTPKARDEKCPTQKGVKDIKAKLGTAKDNVTHSDQLKELKDESAQSNADIVDLKRRLETPEQKRSERRVQFESSKEELEWQLKLSQKELAAANMHLRSSEEMKSKLQQEQQESESKLRESQEILGQVCESRDEMQQELAKKQQELEEKQQELDKKSEELQMMSERLEKTLKEHQETSTKPQNMQTTNNALQKKLSKSESELKLLKESGAVMQNADDNLIKELRSQLSRRPDPVVAVTDLKRKCDEFIRDFDDISQMELRLQELKTKYENPAMEILKLLFKAISSKSPTDWPYAEFKEFTKYGGNRAIITTFVDRACKIADEARERKCTIEASWVAHEATWDVWGTRNENVHDSKPMCRSPQVKVTIEICETLKGTYTRTGRARPSDAPWQTGTDIAELGNDVRAV